MRLLSHSSPHSLPLKDFERIGLGFACVGGDGVLHFDITIIRTRGGEGKGGGGTATVKAVCSAIGRRSLNPRFPGGGRLAQKMCVCLRSLGAGVCTYPFYRCSTRFGAVYYTFCISACLYNYVSPGVTQEGGNMLKKKSL